MDELRNKRFLTNVARVKGELVELVLLVIIIAFGINLLTSYLNSILSPNLQGVLGGSIIVIGFIYISWRRIYNKPIKQIQHAVVSVQKSKNQFISIRGYNYNSEFKMALDSVFAENSALKKQWSQEPLGHSFKGKEITEAQFKNSKSQKLLKEISEYIYLSHLSTHLTDYFNDDSFDKGTLTVLTRKDVPEIIATNRVLDLISKDMGDRAAFSVTSKESTEPKGEVVMSWSSKGALYNKFELTLPKGSKIYREENSSLTIKNPSLKLNFKIVSEGFSAYVDGDFEKYYMGLNKKDDFLNTNQFQVEIETEISIRPTLMLFSKRIKYQLWAESFINDLNKRFDFKTFLINIQWPTVKTLLYSTKLKATTQKSK